MGNLFKRLGPEDFQAYQVNAKNDYLLSHLQVEGIFARWYQCYNNWQLPPRRVSNSYWSWILEGQAELRLGDSKSRPLIGKGDLIYFRKIVCTR